ncbi:hypothetical protein [Kutzneria albida]|uniref:hypothetical protein n=1 Tax=Kutzneria albida TaxID=43357 RepID=UPI00046D0D5A|nr:hypothetical protein [Kutzneria albida]
MNRVYERWLDRRASQPAWHEGLFPGWRTRSRRRALVVTWVVGCLVCLAAGPLAATFSELLSYWLAIVAAMCLLHLLLKAVTSDAAERPRQLLDERELALRGRYGYVGFRVACWSLVAVALVPTVTPLGHLGFGTYSLAMPLLLLSTGTPTALLAWHLPDEDPDDVEFTTGEEDSRG